MHEILRSSHSTKHATNVRRLIKTASRCAASGVEIIGAGHNAGAALAVPDASCVPRRLRRSAACSLLVVTSADAGQVVFAADCRRHCRVRHGRLKYRHSRPTVTFVHEDVYPKSRVKLILTLTSHRRSKSILRYGRLIDQSGGRRMTVCPACDGVRECAPEAAAAAPPTEAPKPRHFDNTTAQ